MRANARTIHGDRASSSYRTAAGAIGPQGIIATHTYDLTIRSANTIILYSIIVSGYHIYSRRMLVSTLPDQLMQPKLVITVHQKQTVWYNADLTFNDITVPLDVIQ